MFMIYRLIPGFEGTMLSHSVVALGSVVQE